MSGAVTHDRLLKPRRYRMSPEMLEAELMAKFNSWLLDEMEDSCYLATHFPAREAAGAKVAVKKAKGLGGAAEGAGGKGAAGAEDGTTSSEEDLPGEEGLEWEVSGGEETEVMEMEGTEGKG